MEERQKFYDSFLKKMDDELMQIRMDWPRAEDWSVKSIPVLKEHLNGLKSHIQQHPFKNRSEEIYFFKEVKPVVMGRLIFHVCVHNVEARRPSDIVGSSRASDHLLRELEFIRQFFEQHIDLYEYYTSGLTAADSKYFVRNVEAPFTFRDIPQPIDMVYYYGDPEFSTPFDYLFSQFRGFELLKDYLTNEVETLMLMSDEFPEDELRFSGSNADFVEMVALFKNLVKPTDPKTGEPLTEDEIAYKLKENLNVNWGNVEDYKTLKLVSGTSDFPERMQDALNDLKRKWEEEEGDQDYDKDDKN